MKRVGSFGWYGLMIVAFLSVWFIWYAYLCPRLLWKCTYEGHIVPMSEAVITFSTRYHRLPASLGELVSTGILPASGKIYSSPLNHESFFLKPISSERSEFEFDYLPDQVIIRLPLSVYREKRAKWRFTWLREDSLKRSVPQGAKYYQQK